MKALYLFGSVLRGDEKQTSDVDLLVEFETGLRMTRVIPTASEVSIIEGVRTSYYSRACLTELAKKSFGH